ncbi:hypothetical protein [Streptomyces rhizosphaerihabitans]|uniref:hypothetical protein n=1 Tax=Streptomyces rhizosphaerihabitans TaxID=1266770 RepID=UPI0021C23EF2|nr:hypothetical protein [Streptomyces rhizosphaerihabitans]MCT9011297.1 hypothetical protein [Streptomyces rhizosphaerihabitans]
MPPSAGLPPVTLVWDRFDDLPHTLAALDNHDPGQGRITVHPTPGTDSLTGLAWDVLAALGKPVPLTCYQHHDTDAHWAITAAWALACGITHLTVLRAHLLTEARLEALLALRDRAGPSLPLVCHQRRIPTALERALRAVPHRIADATAALPGPTPGRPKMSAPTVPAAPAPSTPTRPLAGRWLNLPALTTLAAIDGDEPRCRCTAPTAHRRGFYPPALPALTAVEVAHRLRTATAHPHLTAALATACFTAASIPQLGTVYLADIAPRRRHDHPSRLVGTALVLHAAPRTFLGSAPAPGRRLPPALHPYRPPPPHRRPPLRQESSRTHRLRRDMQTAAATATAHQTRPRPRRQEQQKAAAPV